MKYFTGENIPIYGIPVDAWLENLMHLGIMLNLHKRGENNRIAKITCMVHIFKLKWLQFVIPSCNGGLNYAEVPVLWCGGGCEVVDQPQSEMATQDEST